MPDVLAPLHATMSPANTPSSGQRLVIRCKCYGGSASDLPHSRRPARPRVTRADHSRVMASERTTDAVCVSPRTPMATRAPDAGAMLQVTSAPPVEARIVSPSRST